MTKLTDSLVLMDVNFRSELLLLVFSCHHVLLSIWIVPLATLSCI